MPNKTTETKSTAFQTGAEYQAQVALGKTVSAEGSFESKSGMYAYQPAYNRSIQEDIIYWRNQPADTPGFANKLQEIQAYLRGTGLSKDNTPAGILGYKDLDALGKIGSVAEANGVPFLDLLKDIYSGITVKADVAKYSKQITSALQLIDLTDATNKLSTAYFNAWGVYPTEKQINKFKNDWNNEAKRQMASTTTSNVETGSASNTLKKTKGITSGEGFTIEEQKQFLGEFLAKNYKFTGKEQSGAAKAIYSQIIDTYKNNFLPVPDLKDVIPFIVDIVSTGDVEAAKQKIEAKIQNIRNTAAKFNPGIADTLLNGEDAKPTADAAAKYLGSKLGRTVNIDETIVYKVMNFNDGGKYRTMNTNEINSFVETLPEWSTSPQAMNKYMELAGTLKQSLGLK